MYSTKGSDKDGIRSGVFNSWRQSHVAYQFQNVTTRREEKRREEKRREEKRREEKRREEKNAGGK
jgi:hypothetical protein